MTTTKVTASQMLVYSMIDAMCRTKFKCRGSYAMTMIFRISERDRKVRENGKGSWVM
jgi:hypothetical protein